MYFSFLPLGASLSRMSRSHDSCQPPGSPITLFQSSWVSLSRPPFKHWALPYLEKRLEQRSCMSFIFDSLGPALILLGLEIRKFWMNVNRWVEDVLFGAWYVGTQAGAWHGCAAHVPPGSAARPARAWVLVKVDQCVSARRGGAI